MNNGIVIISPADVAAVYPGLTVAKALAPTGQKQVFICTDSAGKRLVAKFVQLDFAVYGNTYMRAIGAEERTNRELDLMTRYSSPYLPSLAVGFDQKRHKKGRVEFHCFVEDYAGDTAVNDMIAAAGTLDESTVRHILTDVTEALKIYAADRIIHRDIKPGNIVHNSGTDTYVLIDAGVHLDPANATISNSPVGTPLYFSPEQAAGERRTLDSRSDIYALGLVAYEALTGTNPFVVGAISMTDLERAVRNATLPPSIDLTTYCPALAPTILKMLQRYPYLRHTNPDVLLLELRGGVS